MKDFIMVLLAFLLAMYLLNTLIPDKEIEVHVGKNMEYETDLAGDMKQELMLLK